jgi:hypothetical protein
MKTIPLTQGKCAIVDDGDFEFLNRRKWHAIKTVRKCRTTFYARCWVSKKGKQSRHVLMHLMLCPDYRIVDHKNGDGLDNQRSNLRRGTHGGNQHNMHKYVGCGSRFKGVSWHKQNSYWRAQICVNSQRMYLGVFYSEVSAAIAYDRAAEKYFGEFALTNKALNLL